MWQPEGKRNASYGINFQMSSKFKTMENEFVKALDPFSSKGMFSFGKALETFHPSDVPPEVLIALQDVTAHEKMGINRIEASFL